MDDLSRQIAASLDATPEMLPFLPELLADWKSSPPGDVIRLLEPLKLPPTARALDLGCGKGVLALALVEQLDFRVVGVDAFPSFVEDCKRAAGTKHLGSRCEFHCGDLRDWLNPRDRFDVVTMIGVGAVLGDLEATVAALRSCVRPGGYIVIDDAYLESDDADKPAGYELYANQEETIRRLTSHGDKLIAEHIPAPEETEQLFAADTAVIRERAVKLAEEQPDAAPLVNQFVARQETETRLATHTIRSAVWLLQRGD